MDQEILNQVNYWLQQTWVFLPAVLSFISAFGIPSLVQVAKIISSTKLFLAKTDKVQNKINENVKLVNDMSAFIAKQIDQEIAYLKADLPLTANKKKAALIEQRIAELEASRTEVTNFGVIDILKEEEVSKKAIKQELKQQKKLKVKVSKGA